MTSKNVFSEGFKLAWPFRTLRFIFGYLPLLPRTEVPQPSQARVVQADIRISSHLEKHSLYIQVTTTIYSLHALYTNAL